jgi:hypothetical protein
MGIIIDRTGIELSAGPLSFHLTGSLVGLAWGRRIDAMLQWGRGLSEGWRPAVWNDGPGHYGASMPGLLLSLVTGGHADGLAFDKLFAEVQQ